MPPVIAALDILEDALSAALPGPVWWDAAPADTTRRLRLAPGAAERLERATVLQHQDGGGRRADYLSVAGWTGQVTVRCIAASNATARAARDAAHAALMSLAQPTGYSVRLTYIKPLPVLGRDGIFQRALIYQATIRRAAIATAAGPFLLLENGSRLLLEDGGRILLEA